MQKVFNDLQNSLESRASGLLRTEITVEKNKVKLRAFWRGIMQLLDLDQSDPTLRWGYGFINSFGDTDNQPQITTNINQSTRNEKNQSQEYEVSESERWYDSQDNAFYPEDTSLIKATMKIADGLDPKD